MTTEELNQLNPAEAILVEILETEFNHTTIRFREVKDFQLQGDESNKDIYMYAHDYMGELHTERCYAASAAKHGYDEY